MSSLFNNKYCKKKILHLESFLKFILCIMILFFSMLKPLYVLFLLKKQKNVLLHSTISDFNTYFNVQHSVSFCLVGVYSTNNN